MTLPVGGWKPPEGTVHGQQATLEEALAYAALCEASLEFAISGKLSNRELGRIAVYLRRHPNQWGDPSMAPYINAILDRFAIDYPPLPPGSVAKGYLVDWSVDYGHLFGPVAPGKVRRHLAEQFGMSVSTLRGALWAYRDQLRRYWESVRKVRSDS